MVVYATNNEVLGRAIAKRKAKTSEFFRKKVQLFGTIQGQWGFRTRQISVLKIVSINREVDDINATCRPYRWDKGNAM